MTSLSEKQSDFIKKALINCGFKNIQIEINGKTGKGDGYMSIVQFLTVSYLDKHENNKKIQLILKTAQTGAFREQAPVRKAFLREIYMYEAIIPEFIKFQNAKSVLKPFAGVAKFYGGLSLENQENLLLENIKLSGYQLWDRKVPMTSDHIILVLKEYAKFHATSLAMRHLKPEKFHQLTGNLVTIFEGNLLEEIEIMLTNEMQTVFEALGDKHDFAKKGLEKCVKDSMRFFTEEMTNPMDQLVVIHGDCWCNNMMFKYDDKNHPSKPTKVCFLDWQLSQKGSPVLDVSYFFVGHADREILRNSSKYLKIYHNTLSENLVNFGCDPEQIFSYDLFMTHWKKYVKFGIYMSLIITKVLLGDAEDMPDFAELAESGKNALQALHRTPRNEDVVKAVNQRFCDLMVFLAESDWF